MYQYHLYSAAVKCVAREIHFCRSQSHKFALVLYNQSPNIYYLWPQIIISNNRYRVAAGSGQVCIWCKLLFIIVLWQSHYNCKAGIEISDESSGPGCFLVCQEQEHWPISFWINLVTQNRGGVLQTIFSLVILAVVRSEERAVVRFIINYKGGRPFQGVPLLSLGPMCSEIFQ